MSGKNLALIMIVVGLVVGLVSVFAEQIGLGRGQGFGHRQLTGTIVGALILLIGLVKYSKAPKTA
jgi:uncharacterized membrane protein